MIIDLILDRYDGKAYKADAFYRDVMKYGGDAAYRICEAMDYGEEDDIRRELCSYVDGQQYNPLIKDFVKMARWLDDDDGIEWENSVDILGDDEPFWEPTIEDVKVVEYYG